MIVRLANTITNYMVYPESEQEYGYNLLICVTRTKRKSKNETTGLSSQLESDKPKKKIRLESY